MSSNINELLQDFVNKDYDELVKLAQNALVEIMPACKAADPENEGVLLGCCLMLAAVGADGILTAKERQFFKDVIGFDDEKIDNLIKIYDSRMAQLADNFADALPQELKVQVAIFVLAFVSCDEKISSEETAFVRKLME